MVYISGVLWWSAYQIRWPMCIWVLRYWSCLSEELQRRNLLAIIAGLTVLSIWLQSRSCVYHIHWRQFGSYAILSVKWCVRSILVSANAEDAALRLGLARNRREHAAQIWLLLGVLLLTFTFKHARFSLDSMSVFVEARSWHERRVILSGIRITKQTLECLIDTIWAESLGSWLSVLGCCWSFWWVLADARSIGGRNMSSRWTIDCMCSCWTSYHRYWCQWFSLAW